MNSRPTSLFWLGEVVTRNSLGVLVATHLSLISLFHIKEMVALTFRTPKGAGTPHIEATCFGISR